MYIDSLTKTIIAMEKWARKLHLIVNKRDALLMQLNRQCGKEYTYLSLKHLIPSQLKSEEAKFLYAQLQKAVNDYNLALKERDEKMFGNFLDSLIHEQLPSNESQDWCANQF